PGARTAADRHRGRTGPGLSPAPPPAVGADGADDVQVAVALGAFTALAALTAHLTRQRLRRP
ncbi:hypothetical protein, partial [Nonomuraea sp. KM90]|uniref:hypothetical protein n=1 Tax=Nonomuraea sp. KM90 TaxID=3457428 RepID=UPI003FCD1E6A